MGKIITVINQKGGVGKTTSAAAIGEGLSRKGYKVLFVDLDAQGNLSYSLQADRIGLSGYSAMEVLEGRATAENAIQQTPSGDVIASSPALAGADLSLTDIGKEHRLSEALEGLRERYDYIIVDTPPSLGILAVNALTASDECIIPAQADFYSLQGIGQLYKTIQTVKRYCNPSLSIMGIVLTRFSPRAVISRDVSEMIEETAEQMGTKLFKTKIRECTALKEAQALGVIYDYAPRSNAAKDYKLLVDEIIES